MADPDPPGTTPDPVRGGAGSESASRDPQFHIKEIEERGAYIRHSAELFANWFTWHAAANFAAMGWVATTITDKENMKTRAIAILPLIFLVVSPLALFACAFMHRNLATHAQRVQAAWSALAAEARQSVGEPNLVPVRFYTRCLLIMAAGCVLLATVWAMILVYILVCMPVASF